MIPKIIHYCWFGESDIPPRLKKCMRSWKDLMPDFTIMRWDENTFDVNSTQWTKEAYAAKKYAFVSDYVRLVALEEYGGIYLDTDVMVKKPFDNLLCYHAFTGFENECYLTSAVIGCEAHFPLLREFLDSYNQKSFFDSDGNPNKEANVVMITNICLKYGLTLNDMIQNVNGLQVFPRTFFCPLDFYHNDNQTEQTMAIHYFDASWLDDETKKMVNKERTMFHKTWCRMKSYLANYIR